MRGRSISSFLLLTLSMRVVKGTLDLVLQEIRSVGKSRGVDCALLLLLPNGSNHTDDNLLDFYERVSKPVVAIQVGSRLINTIFYIVLYSTVLYCVYALLIYLYSLKVLAKMSQTIFTPTMSPWPLVSWGFLCNSQSWQCWRQRTTSCKRFQTPTS